MSEELDIADLPTLQEGQLDSDTLRAYFKDLASHAQVFDVIAKGAPQAYAGEGTLDLRAGQMLLESGELRGLQIRYNYDDAEWWDTLICGQDGVRLVRIEHHFE